MARPFGTEENAAQRLGGPRAPRARVAPGPRPRKRRLPGHLRSSAAGRRTMSRDARGPDEPAAPPFLRLGGQVPMFGAMASEEPGAVGRNPADVSVLLVELGRALKGWSFYPGGHPARQELLDRTALAFQGELRRNGALALEIRRGAFRLPGSEAPIGAGRLDDLARQLFVRSVRHVVFDAALDATSLAAFLDVLATDADSLAAAGGFEAAFYTGMRHGIQVNE